MKLKAATFIGLTFALIAHAADFSSGVKQILNQASQKATQQLSQTDGFYKNARVKIPVPQEVAQISAKLRSIGLGSNIDQFEEALNRAAEDATRTALDIFVASIQAMTLDDAAKIISGPRDSATQYLKSSSSRRLTDAFRPIVDQSLERSQAKAHWKRIADTYNRIPFVKKVNPDLVGYTTEKALTGIFTITADEEGRIRDNPAERTTDLLKEIFGG